METFAERNRNGEQALDAGSEYHYSRSQYCRRAYSLGVALSSLNLRALAVGRTPPVDPQLWDNGSVFNIFTWM